MIMKEKRFKYNYKPENRTRDKGTIIIHYSNDPYMRCKEEVDVVYNKARRLLEAVEMWVTYSVDDEITEETVKVLSVEFNKVMAVVTEDIERIITTHKVTNCSDVFEFRDVVTQLQEIADDIFKPYIK